MYINVKNSSLISCIVALFLGMMGCTDDIDVPNSKLSGGDAEVTFTLKDAQASKIETRAVDESTIDDVHIVVFNSNGEYITKGYGIGNKIKLRIPVGIGYTIYAIANTGNADFYSQEYYLKNERQFKLKHQYCYSPENISINNKLMMSGCMKNVSVQIGGQNLSFSIERLVAKINLKIKTAPGIIVTNCTVKNQYVITYLIAHPNANETDENDIEPGDDLDAFYKTSSYIKEQELSLDQNNEATFYMYQNRAGGRVSVEGSKGNLINQLEKAKYAPQIATYVEITTTGGKMYEKATHKIYLGTDNCQNYNVKRNREYTYNINIKDKLTVDTRVNRLEVPSNCYIVPINGKVTFPVSRANEDGNIRLSGSYTAELLWVDNNKKMSAAGTIKAINANVAEGTITVETGRLEGNAVVVVKDNSSRKNIVWSWHIWVTGYDPNSTNISYDNGSKTTVFMDRNLGALNNIVGDAGSMGFLYQWGRKDPFTGADALNSRSFKTVFDKSGNWVNIYRRMIGSRSTNNLSLSINNPTTFYCSNIGIIDWYTSQSSSRNDNLWNLNGAKTVYDPCPPGWRVPLSGDGDQSPWYSEEYVDPNLNTYNKGWNWVNGFYSLGWYPAISNRDVSNGALNGKTFGYYWTATNYYSSAYAFKVTEWDIQPSATIYRATGCAVRCVKE